MKKPKLTSMIENGAVISDMTFEIVIRYFPKVKKDWIVKNITDDRQNNVLHSYELDKATTIIVCREVIK